MAKKQSKLVEPEVPEANLTPMIDIVFNLIIFFMIVSELSNLTVEELTLPFADRAKEPKEALKDEVEKVLQVNVMPPTPYPGVIKVRGAAYTMDPELKDRYPNLQEFLKTEAAGYEREHHPADDYRSDSDPNRVWKHRPQDSTGNGQSSQQEV